MSISATIDVRMKLPAYLVNRRLTPGVFSALTYIVHVFVWPWMVALFY